MTSTLVKPPPDSDQSQGPVVVEKRPFGHAFHKFLERTRKVSTVDSGQQCPSARRGSFSSSVSQRIRNRLSSSVVFRKSRPVPQSSLSQTNSDPELCSNGKGRERSNSRVRWHPSTGSNPSNSRSTLNPGSDDESGSESNIPLNSNIIKLVVDPPPVMPPSDVFPTPPPSPGDWISRRSSQGSFSVLSSIPFPVSPDLDAETSPHQPAPSSLSPFTLQTRSPTIPSLAPIPQLLTPSDEVLATIGLAPAPPRNQLYFKYIDLYKLQRLDSAYGGLQAANQMLDMQETELERKKAMGDKAGSKESRHPHDASIDSAIYEAWDIFFIVEEYVPPGHLMLFEFRLGQYAISRPKYTNKRLHIQLASSALWRLVRCLMGLMKGTTVFPVPAEEFLPTFYGKSECGDGVRRPTAFVQAFEEDDSSDGMRKPAASVNDLETEDKDKNKGLDKEIDFAADFGFTTEELTLFGLNDQKEKPSYKLHQVAGLDGIRLDANIHRHLHQISVESLFSSFSKSIDPPPIVPPSKIPPVTRDICVPIIHATGRVLFYTLHYIDGTLLGHVSFCSGDYLSHVLEFICFQFGISSESMGFLDPKVKPSYGPVKSRRIFDTSFNVSFEECRAGFLEADSLVLVRKKRSLAPPSPMDFLQADDSVLTVAPSHWDPLTTDPVYSTFYIDFDGLLPAQRLLKIWTTSLSTTFRDIERAVIARLFHRSCVFQFPLRSSGVLSESELSELWYESVKEEDQLKQLKRAPGMGWIVDSKGYRCDAVASLYDKGYSKLVGSGAQMAKQVGEPDSGQIYVWRGWIWDIVQA